MKSAHQKNLSPLGTERGFTLLHPLRHARRRPLVRLASPPSASGPTHLTTTSSYHCTNLSPHTLHARYP